RDLREETAIAPPDVSEAVYDVRREIGPDADVVFHPRIGTARGTDTSDVSVIVLDECRSAQRSHRLPVAVVHALKEPGGRTWKRGAFTRGVTPVQLGEGSVEVIGAEDDDLAGTTVAA